MLFGWFAVGWRLPWRGAANTAPFSRGFPRSLCKCCSNDARPTHGVRAQPGKGCPRCGFEVYAAEQMISKNRIWHKRCFNCKDCNRSLDSTNLNDGPDNDIYCRGCYMRNFGPKGCGFGIGAGTLTMA